MIAAIADMPPHIQERIICSISAAVKYEIPANILLAIAEKEGGRPGQKVRNKNGTYDFGSMQFNTVYINYLSKYGITENDVSAQGCYSYDLAAWRIRGHLLKDKGDIWTKAANYHSKTYRYNKIYRDDLVIKANKWADWLDDNFRIKDITSEGGVNIEYSTEVENIKNKINSKNTATTPRGYTQNGSYTPRAITFN